MHKYFAIIPARGGSKGIKNKNLQNIIDKPMIEFTFEATQSSKLLDYKILSSDDTSAILLAKDMKIDVPFIRPKELSLNDSKTTDVILHALEWYKTKFSKYPDNIVLLQPTSPFRTGEDIDNAIRKYEKIKTNSLVSVTEVTQHPSDCITIDAQKKINRIILNENSTSAGRQGYEKVYFIDGGIYISSSERFLREKTLFDKKSMIYKIKRSHAIDIDHPFDLELARAMYSYKNNSDTNLFDI